MKEVIKILTNQFRVVKNNGFVEKIEQKILVPSNKTYNGEKRNADDIEITFGRGRFKELNPVKTWAVPEEQWQEIEEYEVL